MQIAIWGAGAVGLGLAATLAREGEVLDVLARDARTIRTIERTGLKRSGRFGSRHAAPATLRVHTDPARLLDAPPDFLLVCTKAHATAGVAAALEPLAPRLPETRLVLCQNGWGNEAPFLHFWPRSRLFHARVITGFQRRTSTEVEVTAHAAPIALGHLYGAGARPDRDADANPDVDSCENVDATTLAPLAHRMSEGGLPAETVDDMAGVLWAKMLYNCALNPLGALAGRRYGELTADRWTRPLVEGVVHEIAAVLKAARIPIAWPDAEHYLEAFHRELIPPTAQHESSMLQDLRAGRRTEIEALCGAVERLGEREGVATPIVSSLATLVRAAEARDSD